MKSQFRIEDFLNDLSAEEPRPEWETFLAEEGFELLAAYRAIEDKKIRLALLNLVKLVSGDAPSEN